MSAQNYNANFTLEKMGASQTLKKGYAASYRAGLIVVSADSTSANADRFAGFVRNQEVKSDASSKYSASKYGDTDHYAYVEVQKNEGPFLVKVVLDSEDAAYIGNTVYTYDGSVPSVVTSTDSTNSIEVGYIEKFVNSEQDPTPIEDEYITSDGWALVRVTVL